MNPEFVTIARILESTSLWIVISWYFGNPAALSHILNSGNTDDLLDDATTTIEKLGLLEIEADEYLTQKISLNDHAAEEKVYAIQRLSSNLRVATDRARRGKGLGNDVESLYRAAITDLFNKAKDFNPLMARFHHLEFHCYVSNMIDRAHDPADVIYKMVINLS